MFGYPQEELKSEHYLYIDENKKLCINIKSGENEINCKINKIILKSILDSFKYELKRKKFFNQSKNNKIEVEFKSPIPFKYSLEIKFYNINGSYQSDFELVVNGTVFKISIHKAMEFKIILKKYLKIYKYDIIEEEDY